MDQEVERGVTSARMLMRFQVDGRIQGSDVMSEAGMRYAYTEASAVEVWTDDSYIQRSWSTHSYFVRVLRSDWADGSVTSERTR